MAALASSTTAPSTPGAPLKCFSCGDSVSDRLSLIAHVSMCVHGDHFPSSPSSSSSSRSASPVHGVPLAAKKSTLSIPSPSLYSVPGSKAAPIIFSSSGNSREGMPPSPQTLHRRQIQLSHEGYSNADYSHVLTSPHVASTEKPFQCTVCGKCFSRKLTLTRHLQTHSGVKPYQCDICGKRLSRKHVLMQHLKTHMPKEGSSTANPVVSGPPGSMPQAC
jgi:uncharacterized Zn-finger protein